MSIRHLPGVLVIAVAVAGCQMPVSPDHFSTTSAVPLGALHAVIAEDAAAGIRNAANSCHGKVVAGIASTWPWAHMPGGFFRPPVGSLHQWVVDYGAVTGISTPRDLQVRFCGLDF